MTQCGSYGSLVYTLVFSGTSIGDHIHSYQHSFHRLEEIAQRQNFWSSTVILDGRYPAIVHEHRFLIYEEESDRLDYVRDMFLLANHVHADPYPLETRVKSTTVIAYGNCYMQSAAPQEPDELLLLEAGIYSISFWGTQIPSVT